MHVRRSFACAFALLAFSTGCLETTEDVDVRPDGSLHVEITAKGPVTDLADGYPLPLSGPWRANNAETLAWLRDVGNDTGSAGTRAAAERLPEKGEPLSREGDEVLAVEADFASVRELPALFAPPSEPYASAHFRRSTELSIERKNGRTVYVFERTLQAREFERYDAWSRMQPNLSDALVRKVEQQDALGADELEQLAHEGERGLRGGARSLAEDALAAIWIEGDASLSAAGRERCLAAVDTALARVVTPEGLRAILTGLLQHAATQVADVDAGERLRKLERDVRDALRETLARALDDEGAARATRNAVLGQLEWLLTAVDQTSDLADEHFVLRVRMPGEIVGGNYTQIENGRAVFETRGIDLRDRAHVLRVVSVVE